MHKEVLFVSLMIYGLLGGFLAKADPPLGPPAILWEERQIQNPVEQQTIGSNGQQDLSMWILNTTNYVWDVDDSDVPHFSDGSLQPGESAEWVTVIIGDEEEHMLVCEAYADLGSNIVAEIEFNDGINHLLFTSNPSDVIRDRWPHAIKDVSRVIVTLFTPAYMATYPINPIPNSGNAPNAYYTGLFGGWGRIQNVTLRVTNMGDKPIKRVRFKPEVDTDMVVEWRNKACPDGNGMTHNLCSPLSFEINYCWCNGTKIDLP